MQYIVDSQGIKISVVVPIEDWKRMNEDYIKNRNKQDVIQTIKDGLDEIKSPKKNGFKLQTLTEFLNENNC